jgi:hypothetical protein
MTPNTPLAADPTEALLREQADALIRDLIATGDAAPDGHVLARLEGFLLTRGREFLRRALEAAAQAQAAGVEKKGRRRGPVRAATAAPVKGSPAATS